MIEEVTITIPKYALRYLYKMCESEREYLAGIATTTFGPTLGLEAAYDSLNAIECALPELDK